MFAQTLPVMVDTCMWVKQAPHNNKSPQFKRITAVREQQLLFAFSLSGTVRRCHLRHPIHTYIMYIKTPKHGNAQPVGVQSRRAVPSSVLLHVRPVFAAFRAAASH
jgi:hypothetical protein